jgi:hypothetical protein
MGDEGSGSFKVLSMSNITKILSIRLLIHSSTMDTLWGISLQSLVEQFFELYESLLIRE